MAGYIRIPQDNLARNENELRAVVDGLRAAIERVKVVADKMGQMGTDAELAVEYNLPDEQTANDLRALVGSAATELNDPVQVPFTTQLVQRVA